MSTVLRWVRSPAARWVFLGVALAMAVYAVASSWDRIIEAGRELTFSTLVLSLALSVVYVVLTMESWRAVLRDLGSSLSLRGAVALFGLSQVGKYVPGGVWNIVAAAELGADQEIPRRRSVAAMAVTVLISLVSGLALGFVSFALAPPGRMDGLTWIAWATPVLVALLVPPVLNRCISLAFRLLRRPPLEKAMSGRGTLVATTWALLAWVAVGLQVWVLGIGMGQDVSARSLALAVGGYALAWVVGFLVIIVPAGAGAREGVLIAILGGTLPSAAVLLLVLMSRALLTVVDLALAGVAMVLTRQARARRALVAQHALVRPETSPQD